MPTYVTEEKKQQWTAALTTLSQESLEFAPDFPRIAQRHEAFWAHQCLDRPLLLSWMNTKPERPTSKHLEVIREPDRWLAEKYADMCQTQWIGDSIPHIRVDFGPVIMTMLAGLEPQFVSDTTWYHPIIHDDWSNAPDWTFDDNSTWMQLLLELLHLTAVDAAGRYAVCTPNLGGTDEVLLNYRGSGNLCMDVIDQPERIIEAVQAIHPGWEKMTALLYDTILEHDAPLIQWQHLWSNQPYTLPSSDFNALIGPRDFQKLFMFDIERRAKTVGRASFHLDGPDAARHIDTLLDCEALDVIQFTPGDGKASARTYGEMFRKVQSRGKSCLIACGKDDVFPLCDVLQPEGLAFLMFDAFSPEEHLAFYNEFCRYFHTQSSLEEI
ncbi:MAG: hypothetical protein V2J07_03540 [Anaerolineae bacterium]|jgi:hypothetical protein|nr:hypothetical protein [Anaerolineae bacterium]